MKKKLLFVITILVVIGLYVIYYYCPRKVSFELAMVIEKPCKEFDNSHFIGFEYANNKENLIYWMVEHYKYYYSQGQTYDSLYVENLSNELDFNNFDYLIAYQKQLKELKYSPYLTKTEDGLYFDKRTPLIPTWDSVITDKVYLYRIIKNNKFRAPGP